MGCATPPPPRAAGGAAGPEWCKVREAGSIGSARYRLYWCRFSPALTTEEACQRYLAACRWPEGFVCPRCGHNRAYELVNQCALSMRQVSARGFVDVGNDPASDEDCADPLVLGGVFDDHRQAWCIRSLSSASARPVLLRDRVDAAPQTTARYGECGPGTPARRGRG